MSLIYIKSKNKMILLAIFAIIFAVFAFDSIIVICVHRHALGKFHVSADWQRYFAFTSSTGQFSIRNDLRQIHCIVNGHKTIMKFEDLRCLEHQTESKLATLGEFILDLDMEEHWKEERDYIVWHTISLIFNDDTLIPVFKSGKYVRRKHLHDFYTEAQLAILESLGLLINVDDQSRKILSNLKQRLDFPQVSDCLIEN